MRRIRTPIIGFWASRRRLNTKTKCLRPFGVIARTWEPAAREQEAAIVLYVHQRAERGPWASADVRAEPGGCVRQNAGTSVHRRRARRGGRRDHGAGREGARR